MLQIYSNILEIRLQEANILEEKRFTRPAPALRGSGSGSVLFVDSVDIPKILQTVIYVSVAIVGSLRGNRNTLRHVLFAHESLGHFVWLVFPHV